MMVRLSPPNSPSVANPLWDKRRIYFQFSNGFSLFVSCENQEEVDEYWNKFIDAGANQCNVVGSLIHSGLTWQIVPKRFMELINDPNRLKVKAVMDAMMEMVKLEIAPLEKAYKEA